MVFYVSDEKPDSFGALEARGIREEWQPAKVGKSAIADLKALCTRISNAIRASGAVLIVDESNAASAAPVAAMQMVALGLSAERAAELMKNLSGSTHQSVASEQMLWDLELAIDLEGDTRSAIFIEDAPLLHFGVSKKAELASSQEDQLAG
jgi:hypothetical protein